MHKDQTTEVKLIATHGLLKSRLSDNEKACVMGAFSNTCPELHGLFKEGLTKRAIKKLYQAAFDDDFKTVKNILNSRLDLMQKCLLEEPPKDFYIVGKKTLQEIYPGKLLTMVASRKQPVMLKLLLRYVDDLEQTNEVTEARDEALSAWPMYEIQLNKRGKLKIVIPSEYVNIVQELIDVLKKENSQNKEISKKTREALSSFYEMVLPTEPMSLDEYPDMELLLLAVDVALRNNFHVDRKSTRLNSS